MTELIWFRRDLRLLDNPALAASLARGGKVIAAYVHDPEGDGDGSTGSAGRWYLHHSLLDLSGRLAALGIPLACARGDAGDCLLDLATRHQVRAVHFNRINEPGQRQHEARLQARLARAGIETHAQADDLLLPDGSVRKHDGTPYRVFTPFARAARARLDATPPHSIPFPHCPQPAIPADVAAVHELALLDAHSWHHKLGAHWQPGEPAARARLTSFLDRVLADYREQRDMPGVDGTSRLSPALHWGEISPGQIYRALLPILSGHGQAGTLAAAERFLDELLWREFAYDVLNDEPSGESSRPMRRFEPLWSPNLPALRAWQRGETGFNLVDAGLRELWETGWMHNRVRMVAASFLTKQLGVHWREGAAWFRETLVDYDLASNTLGWQWVAGCGVDAAPYYRIFNPDTQAERFDPQATYIQRWLGAGLRPPPIVDLATSRAAALARYRALPA
jgi:deoxyribodipyrimidine photo-lyase